MPTTSQQDETVTPLIAHGYYDPKKQKKGSVRDFKYDSITLVIRLLEVRAE